MRTDKGVKDDSQVLVCITRSMVVLFAKTGNNGKASRLNVEG